MSQVDWENAPSDAQAYIDGVFSKWVKGFEYEYRESKWEKLVDGETIEWYAESNAYNIEMRPDEWKKGAERMEPIVQNGNDGEYYAELENFDKQPRYKGDGGLGAGLLVLVSSSSE